MSPHTTHHDDCGCKSAAYEQRITELELDLAKSESARATINEVAKSNAERARLGDEMLAEARLEAERLKVCGTCDLLRGVDCHYCGTEDDWDMMVDILDRCHFTPSRWELAEELRDV